MAVESPVAGTGVQRRIRVTKVLCLFTVELLVRLLEIGEDDTWTHSFCHLLTGPRNTGAAPYREDARPRRDPAASMSSPKCLMSVVVLCFVYLRRTLGE